MTTKTTHVHYMEHYPYFDIHIISYLRYGQPNITHQACCGQGFWFFSWYHGGSGFFTKPLNMKYTPKFVSVKVIFFQHILVSEQCYDSAMTNMVQN